VAINANSKEVFRYEDEETKQSQFMEGEPGTSVNGGWQFVAPEGLAYELEYVADNNGFQPKANHIPLPIEDTNEVAEAKAEFLSRFKSAKNKEPINGAWEFESPEGMTYKLSYKADQLGGFLAEADHIPVQVDDTEEVKAAKDAFYKVFDETSAKLKALHKEMEMNIPKLEQESLEEHNIIEVRRRKRDDYGSENDEKDVLEYEDDNLMVENKETMNYVPKYYNYKSHPFWKSHHPYNYYYKHGMGNKESSTDMNKEDADNEKMKKSYFQPYFYKYPFYAHNKFTTLKESMDTKKAEAVEGETEAMPDEGGDMSEMKKNQPYFYRPYYHNYNYHHRPHYYRYPQHLIPDMKLTEEEIEKLQTDMKEADEKYWKDMKEKMEKLSGDFSYYPNVYPPITHFPASDKKSCSK